MVRTSPGVMASHTVALPHGVIWDQIVKKGREKNVVEPQAGRETGVKEDR